MKQKLVIITDNFPYGAGEASFILPELPYLQRYFDVCIFSRNATRSATARQEYVLDKTISVTRNRKTGAAQKLFALFKIVFHPYLLKIFARECCLALRKAPKPVLAIKDILSFDINALCVLKALADNGLFDDIENTVYYSYWFSVQALALVYYKRKRRSMKILTRAHGYDLFNERARGGLQPFKMYMDAAVDLVVFVSQAGMDYYLNTWNKRPSDKYCLCRLGAVNKTERRPCRHSGTNTIVSCSYMVPLKRINLIIEALALIDMLPVHWIHIGDGSEFNTMKNEAASLLSKKPNITFAFAGSLLPQDVYRFYRETAVDLFITTSSTEGGPVSIMEALSFGIPVMGTNVGGIPEMIADCGILLPSNPAPQEIAAAIDAFFQKPEQEREALSNKARDTWEALFDADRNSGRFADLLRERFSQ